MHRCVKRLGWIWFTGRLRCSGIMATSLGNAVIFRRENSNNGGTPLWKMLSTDLASVGAATFKLILLDNHPIELVQ